MAFYHGQKRKHHYVIDLIDVRNNTIASMAISQWTTKKEAFKEANIMNKVSIKHSLPRFARVRKVSHDGFNMKKKK